MALAVCNAAGGSMNERPNSEPATRTDAPRERGVHPKSFLEVISLFLSTAAALAVVYSTLTGGGTDSAVLLGMATLLTAGCLMLAFITARPFTRRPELRNLIAITASCGVALATAWTVVFWDHLKYGPWTAYLSRDPAVVVSDNIAWLKLKTPDYVSSSLVAYVAQLAADKPVRAIGADDVASYASPSVLLINGSEDGDVVTIEARVVGTKFKPKNDSSASTAMDYRGLATTLLDSNRFMYQPSVRQDGIVVVNVARSAVAHAVRLVFHLARGVASAHENAFADADRHFDAVLALRTVLKDDELRAEYSSALKTIARYLVDRPTPRAAVAMEAIRSARALTPNDGEAAVSESFLQHMVGDDSRALQGLTDAVLVPHDPAVVETLRALVERSRGDFWTAAVHYAAAARLEPPIQRERADVSHVAAAYLYAFSSHSAEERSIKIREESAALIRSVPQSPLSYLLEGFSLAIVDNALAEESFLRADNFARGTLDRALIKYWHALGLAESALATNANRNRSKALSDAVDLLRDSRRLNPASAATLSLLGTLTNDISLVKDAHALDSGDPHANRSLGLHLQKQALGERNRERKVRLQKTALAHLSDASKAGAGDPDVYAAMGEISQDLASPDDARRYKRESHRLRCDGDSRHPSCLVVTIQDSLDRARSTSGAEQALQLAKAQTRSLVLSYKENHERARAAVLEVGVSWYQTGNREIAGALYEALEEELRHDTRRDDDRERIAATVTCNHAFIILDHAVGQQEQLKKVAAAFRASAQALQSADCFAGLAATLVALGEIDQARNNYRIARAMDANYANVDVLRRTYAWSDQALQLISRVSTDV